MRRALSLAALPLVAACQTDAPTGQTYFDRVIEPILVQSCAKNTGGCHQTDANDPFKFAAGNLDVTSFESIHKRPDVLRTFSAYPVPFLLLKAAAETTDLTIEYRGGALPSLVPHSGGSILSTTSQAFLTLQTWLENGATRDGVRPLPAAVMGSGPCTDAAPDDFDESTVTGTSQWSSLAGNFDGVQSILSQQSCNSRNCHGAPQSDFFLTCGNGARQKAWNFRQVWAYSTQDPIDASEVLRRPVANGQPHTGGAHFADQNDPSYQTILAFIRALNAQFALPASVSGSAGFIYFAQNVMPILIQRGCGSEGCHSPAAMNDFKIRSGSRGMYSPAAIEKNYVLAKNDFMAFEVPDVRRSRLVAKNIFASSGGIAHRGGALLEYNGGSAANCSTTPTSPVCVLQGWADIERGAVSGLLQSGDTVRVVYVKRPAAVAGSSLLDFTNFAPGAELHVTGVTPAGNPDGSDTVLCPTGGADIRAPDVKNDGKTIVFAMRKSAGDQLHLYTVDIGGGGCAQVPGATGAFDFDPAWSPDGNWIVFASTQRAGTSLRLKLPQSDIWRMHPDGTGREPMTFLSNSEIGPQFNREGRVTMTTEKVDGADAQNGFYQLSGRRINWDLTDYHPLLGQRKSSPVDPASPADSLPSIDFTQVTEIREALDGNFLMIGSEPGAAATAGSVVIFNRSVGPIEADRTDPGYLRSATVIAGTFRSPTMLPSGSLLVSEQSGSGFDLTTYSQAGSKLKTIVGCGGAACVEAVPAIPYPARPFYLNRRQLVFGGSGEGGDSGHAIVHFPDFPMVATLLGSNLRRGRDVAGFRSADHLTVYDASGSMLGSAALADDGSVKLKAPAGVPLYLGLTKSGSSLFKMTEEHQFGPGEEISIGVPESMFNHVCAGCHGSVGGQETDVGVTADALTAASASASLDKNPVSIGN